MTEFDDRSFVLECIEHLLSRRDLPIDCRERLERIRDRVLKHDGRRPASDPTSNRPKA